MSLWENDIIEMGGLILNFSNCPLVMDVPLGARIDKREWFFSSFNAFLDKKAFEISALLRERTTYHFGAGVPWTAMKKIPCIFHAHSGERFLIEEPRFVPLQGDDLIQWKIRIFPISVHFDRNSSMLAEHLSSISIIDDNGKVLEDVPMRLGDARGYYGNADRSGWTTYRYDTTTSNHYHFPYFNIDASVGTVDFYGTIGVNETTERTSQEEDIRRPDQGHQVPSSGTWRFDGTV